MRTLAQPFQTWLVSGDTQRPSVRQMRESRPRAVAALTLAVVSERQHVFARRQVVRHLELVHDAELEAAARPVAKAVQPRRGRRELRAVALAARGRGAAARALAGRNRLRSRCFEAFAKEDAKGAAALTLRAHIEPRGCVPVLVYMAGNSVR